MALEKVYSTNEAARALGISKRSLLQYCRERRISYVRLKGKFVFRESVLDMFLGRNSVPATNRHPVTVHQGRAA